MTKAVLDTNVYLSAIIFGGNCRSLLDLLFQKKFIAVTSPAILLEISDKLKGKFQKSEKEVLETIKEIGQIAETVEPKIKLNVVKDDKNDNKIIEAATEANVQFIVSGDHHLLKIKQYKGIKIVSPAEFLTQFLSHS